MAYRCISVRFEDDPSASRYVGLFQKDIIGNSGEFHDDRFMAQQIEQATGLLSATDSIQPSEYWYPFVRGS